MPTHIRTLKQLALVAVIIVITVVVTLSGVLSSCSGQPYSDKTESATLATLQLETSALVYIAQDKHYFSENGLTITVQEFDTGVATIGAVLNKQADIAGLSEFVMVGDVLQKREVSILGTYNRSLSTDLVALRNRGISSVSDLAGKRIGLSRGTSGEFYLGRFLELNGMSIKDIVIVDLPPSKWVDAISSGDVDAIVGWAPYTTQIQEHFANEVVYWQVQSGQPVFGVIAGSNDWIANHSEAIVRFWKSLAQAEEFLIRHPDDAKAIVQKRLNYDDAYMETVWPRYTFTTLLDQSLILSMEDEVRWMISNNLTTEKKMPNFLDYINAEGLKAANPGAVRIVGK